MAKRLWSENDLATKRILKMESALCSVIRECNGKPSAALLQEIQRIALIGVGLQQSALSR
jgi:hypothetical protein